MALWAWGRLGVAVLAAGLGLLAVFRVPHGALWKPAVGATEWGHLLAGVALLAAVGPIGDRVGRAAAVVGLVAAALLGTPVARAWLVARALPARYTAAFGRPAPGAPFSFGALLARGPARPPTLLTFPAADGSVLRMDLYRPDGPGPFPLVVSVHGGSWNSGDRTVLPDLAQRLASEGVAVAAVEYRLAPAHRWPAQREDVAAAVAWLRAHAAEHGLDGQRVVLHGRSAGGHLALAVAYADPSIRGVVAMYPPTDLVWSWEHPTHPWVLDTPGTLEGLVGGPLTDATRARYVDASPLLQVHVPVPTLLVHGTRDELVFAEQSRRLGAVLAARGAPHLVVELPWGTHGTDANPSGPGGQITTWLVERFVADVTAP